MNHWVDKVLYWAWMSLTRCTIAPATQKFIIRADNKYKVRQARFIIDVAPDGTVVDVRTPYEEDFAE